MDWEVWLVVKSIKEDKEKTSKLQRRTKVRFSPTLELWLNGWKANENQTHVTEISQTSPKILAQEVTNDPELELKKQNYITSTWWLSQTYTLLYITDAVSDSILRI